MTTEVKTTPNHERELVLARLIDASPEQVYRAWTTPERYPEWFCPKPWRAESTKMDLRPGGASEVTMYGPNGEVAPNPGLYLEVVPNPDAMMTAVVTFEPQPGGKTLLTARVGHPSAEKKAQHEEMGFHGGWGVMLDQLEAAAQRLGVAA